MWSDANLIQLSLIAVAKNVDRLSQITVAKRSAETIIIRSLKRREIEQICFWLMILSNRQLSFDR
jgi:hypothetical protein